MSDQPADPELLNQMEQSRDAQMQAESEDAAHARLQAQFASDPRIHFSRETQTWHYEGDDGREMEWDIKKNTWVEVVDEDMMKAQQAAYAVAGVDEDTPAAPVLARNKKKRKEPIDYTSNTDPAAAGPSIKRGKPNKAGDNGSGPTRKSKNTAVFVSSLPPDAEADEIAARFGRFGLIMEDDEGKPKVKLYYREDGSFNGDALVVYYKEESVDLAVTLLDDAELRLGEPGTRMKVQKAEFAHKAEGEGSAEANGGHKKGGSSRPIDKKKASKRIVNMEKRLAGWDSDDEFGPAGPKITTSRVVVLKHMFTRQELAEDATLLLDLKEDVREECSTLGEVTNVVLYDEEDDGVMTVKFKDPVSAQACILKMNGRFFAGRKIIAEFYDGRERYRRSGTDAPVFGADGEEGEDAERKRLDDFAAWLMQEGE
ncbi:RNA recognition motif protein [Ceratobasidium sp. AG-Ba]|nr:RNA recognition motif protein [Ceratobasidium sp. AG-Ba]